MIDTKERLAELLGYYMPPIDRNRCMPYLKGECNGLCAECTAKFLVDNGVTINKWIPVSERLPIEEDAIDGGFVLANTEEKVIIALWSDVCRFNEFVTHWMPLPQLPKGE